MILYMNPRSATRGAVVLCALLLGLPAALHGEPYDLVIENGRVMDPDSGLDAIRHVGIMGDTIAAVSETPLAGATTIDAAGRVVAPGFIDLNIHNPDLETNRLRAFDGVTTAFEMEGGTIDLERWREEHESAGVIHYGIVVSYWDARVQVMGDPELEGVEQWKQVEGTKATPDQIDAILKILDATLAEGALGIGIPLEYVPAATQAEMLEVFRVAAKHRAPAHIHIRSWGYDDKQIRSYGDLYEVIGAALVTGADIQVLHINSSYNDWTPIGLELITKAQARGLPVTTEMYPYAFGGCPSSAAYFDDWETYPDEYFSTKLRLASTGEWLTREKFRALRELNQDVGLICYDNTEEMVRLAVQSPITMIASDGGGAEHPRIAGTFSRVLGRYVREEGVLTLMDALRKMTIMPARHLEKRVPAMRRKGRLQPGADADVLVFDPDVVVDRSTVLEPLKPSYGMRHVLVAGVPVVRDGVFQDGAFPGRFIRAPASRLAFDDRVDDVVREHMADRRIPGASIAVVTEDGTATTSAYGTAVIQHGVPAKVDTVYDIASLTKQFTAAAVLMLCDEGKLSLDDSIARYVESAPEAWRGITLGHLLTHTAGLAPEDEEFASLKSDWRRFSPRELMLASAIQDPLRAAPGERFDYASGGYFLAALAVEKASGMTYRQFMRRRVFEPLGMDRTLIHDELRVIPGEARGYSIKDGELVNIWRDAVEEVAGGWGMFSNVPDLIRWERALRDRELLSATSYEAMFSPVELAGGERFRYGLGWWLPERNGIPYQYHSGVTGTEILRIPSRGLTVIVLTNLGRSPSVGSGEANPWGLADKIAGALVPEFAFETRDLPLSDQALAAYAGNWRFGYGEARFFAREGRLWIEDANGTDAMLYQGGDSFGFEGDAERLVFRRSPDGSVTSARWVNETWQDDPGERIAPEP